MTSDSLFYVVKNNKDIFIAGIIVRKVTMFINNFRELIYELIFIYDLIERCQYVNFMYK